MASGLLLQQLNGRTIRARSACICLSKDTGNLTWSEHPARPCWAMLLLRQCHLWITHYEMFKSKCMPSTMAELIPNRILCPNNVEWSCCNEWQRCKSALCKSDTVNGPTVRGRQPRYDKVRKCMIEAEKCCSVLTQLHRRLIDRHFNQRQWIGDYAKRQGVYGIVFTRHHTHHWNPSYPYFR